MKRTFDRKKTTVPKPQDKQGVFDFLMALVKEGMSFSKARRKYKGLIDIHPLRRHHSGTFSPVKKI